MPKSMTPAETARSLYGAALEPSTRRELSRSMSDWAELTDDEQSFTTAHLLYLNLQSQAAGLRALSRIQVLLDEVAEALTGAIEVGLPAEPPAAEPSEDETPAPVPDETP